MIRTTSPADVDRGGFLISCLSIPALGKGKGMSHIRFVCWGVPVRETLVLSHRLCEAGWPVPFLAAFISPVFPPGTHLLLGGQ